MSLTVDNILELLRMREMRSLSEYHNSTVTVPGIYEMLVISPARPGKTLRNGRQLRLQLHFQYLLSNALRPTHKYNIAVRIRRASLLLISRPRHPATENVARMSELLDLPIEIFQLTMSELVKKHGIPDAWKALGASRKYQYRNSTRDIQG